MAIKENKLKMIFDETINNGIEYNGNLKNIQCPDLMNIAINNNQIQKYGINNICMFKYKYYNENSILMIFAIPNKSNEDKRYQNERFFDLLKDIEETFVSLLYRQIEEINGDQYIYFVCIKSIEENDNDF